MNWRLFTIFTVFVALVGFSSSTVNLTAFAQVETSEQQIYSGDLLNDPFIQDLIQKIEQSKIEIEKLQEQEYERLAAQEFLEERRKVALERLNQDILAWQEEWYEYSPEIAYEKFVDKMPERVQEIYRQQFAFTMSKHNAGLDAKYHALSSGADSVNAMKKFARAAETHQRELIVANDEIHELGQFIPKSPEELMVMFIDDVKYDIRKIIDVHERVVREANWKLSQEYHDETQKEENKITQIISNYNSNKIPNKQELGEDIVKTYAFYDKSREDILEQEYPALQQSRADLDENMRVLMDTTLDKYPELKVTWNPNDLSFDVVEMEQSLLSESETASDVTTKSESATTFDDNNDSETEIKHKDNITAQGILNLDERYKERKSHVKSVYYELYENIDNLDKEDAAIAMERYHSYHAITIKELSQQLTDIRNKYNAEKENLLEAENTILDIIQEEHDKQKS